LKKPAEEEKGVMKKGTMKKVVMKKEAVAVEPATMKCLGRGDKHRYRQKSCRKCCPEIEHGCLHDTRHALSVGGAWRLSIHNPASRNPQSPARTVYA